MMFRLATASLDHIHKISLYMIGDPDDELLCISLMILMCYFFIHVHVCYVNYIMCLSTIHAPIILLFKGCLSFSKIRMSVRCTVRKVIIT